MCILSNLSGALMNINGAQYTFCPNLSGALVDINGAIGGYE